MGKKYKISGTSMIPFLKNGDIVEPFQTQHLKLGDIVIIDLFNSKVFHRVVEINKHLIKCKGDNCLHFDWLKINPNSIYFVVRHKHQKAIAIVSLFWGNIFYKTYVKHTTLIHNNRYITKLFSVLQRISFYSIYFFINLTR